MIVLDDSTDVDATQLNMAEGRAPRGSRTGRARDRRRQRRSECAGSWRRHPRGGRRGSARGGPHHEAPAASAYFYDSPEESVELPLRIGGTPAFGSGTLGYVNYTAESRGDFLGASGFLLAEVDVEAVARKADNVAPVSARLIPNIGELALEAKDGTLLRRSQSALFEALARRPRAGNRSQNQADSPDTDPYIPIPSNCIGVDCTEALLPQYSFSSSNESIGDFVTPNTASPDPHAVLLGANEQPIHDSSSGLFCAYNAGTTIVTIRAGGLAASLPVTVRAGSVRRPCGTQPLTVLPAHRAVLPAPPPAPAPAPAAAPSGTPPAAAVLPLAPPPPPVPLPLPARTPTPPAPFSSPSPPLFAPAAFVPLPPPAAGRPAPPSGTSQVTATSSVFQTEPVAEQEKEEEEAIESVSNQAVAYDVSEHEPIPDYLAGLVVLAAFAGASIRRRSRRGPREVRVAPATLTTIHAQRRMAQERRRW